VHRPAADVDRLPDRCEQALGDGLGPRPVDVLEDHDELVPAEAGHRVGGPGDGAQALGDGDQQVVPDPVPA
jgi:hypothetical protein